MCFLEMKCSSNSAYSAFIVHFQMWNDSALIMICIISVQTSVNAVLHTKMIISFLFVFCFCFLFFFFFTVHSCLALLYPSNIGLFGIMV